MRALWRGFWRAFKLRTLDPLAPAEVFMELLVEKPKKRKRVYYDFS